MAKALGCRDVGVDCDFVARGETEEEVLRKASEHGRQFHNKEVTPDMEARMRTAIRDEHRQEAVR